MKADLIEQHLDPDRWATIVRAMDAVDHDLRVHEETLQLIADGELDARDAIEILERDLGSGEDPIWLENEGETTPNELLEHLNHCTLARDVRLRYYAGRPITAKETGGIVNGMVSGTLAGMVRDRIQHDKLPQLKLQALRRRMAAFHCLSVALAKSMRELCVWAEDSEVYTDECWNMNDCLDEFERRLDDWGPE